MTDSPGASPKYPRISRKSRVRRAVLRCAVAILSLYVLYVAAINVFLSTSLFEKVLDGDPDTLFVSYERGWSIWPGRIQARHLTIRSSDSHVQWILRIDRCVFDVSFFDLAVRKTFHVTRVEGSGVAFEARQRVAAPEATPAYVDALPPIPGFDRIPFLKPQLPNLLEKWDDRYYHLWRVQLDDVIANDVREVWIDSVRFEGSARVTGGFLLHPIRKAEVYPSHVDVSRGRVTAKDLPVAEPVTGTVDFTLAAFDPRTAQGVDLFHDMSVTTELRGRLPDLASIPRTLTGPVKMTGPADVNRLAVRVAAGKIVNGSHADVALPGAAIEIERHRFAGDLAVVADVSGASGAAELTFHIDARALTATRTVPDDQALLFHAPAVEVTGDARALDLAEPLRDLHAVVVLPAGDMPDARALARYVPSDASFGFMGGKGHVHARVEAWLDERRAKGEAGLDADDLDLRVAKTRLIGGTKVDASFEDWRWEAKRLGGVHAKVHVAQGSIATEEAADKHLVDVKGFEIGIDAPEVDLDDPMREFQAKVDMPDSEIIDRGLLRSYLPRGKDMKVSKGHARFDAHCAIDVRDHLGAGTFDVHSDRLGFTLDDVELFADVVAHARVHDWRWESGDLALDEAHVDVTRVSSRKRGSARAAGTIARLVVHAKSDRFSFANPFQRIDIGGSIRGGRLADPIALDAFLAKTSKVHFDAADDGARFAVDVEANVDGRVARGRITARGQGIGVRSAKMRVRGDLDASADVTEWQIDGSKLEVARSRIVADDVVAQLGASGAADVRLRHGELDAKIDQLDFGHPSLRGVDYRLVVDDARLDDATRLNALIAAPGSKPPSLSIESGKARAVIDVTVLASKRTASGGVWLVVDDAGVRSNETHLRGDVTFTGVVKGFDRDREQFDFAGSAIALRGVRITGAKARSTSWNGDISLVSGALRASEEPAFDGFVQVRADDATPILALALENTLPKFLVGLVRAPGLSGQSRVVVEPGRIALLDARVRGGDVVAYGDLVTRGTHERGAFVVAKGGLSAGVKLDDGATYVRVFALERWHEQEKRAALALFRGADADAEAKAKADAEAKAKADAKPKVDAEAKARARAGEAAP